MLSSDRCRTKGHSVIPAPPHHQNRSAPYQRPLSNTRPPPAQPELSKNVQRPACGSVGPCPIRSCLGWQTVVVRLLRVPADQRRAYSRTHQDRVRRVGLEACQLFVVLRSSRMLWEAPASWMYTWVATLYTDAKKESGSWCRSESWRSTAVSMSCVMNSSTAAFDVELRPMQRLEHRLVMDSRRCACGGGRGDGGGQ